MSQSPETEPQIESLDSDLPYILALNKANGMINRGASFSGNERNCFFTNIGDFQFADTSSVTGLDFPDDGRAVARVDWDGDGDQDLWVTNRTGPRIRYLKNSTDNQNRFMTIELTGRSCNRNAIGSRIELVLQSGATVVRSVRAGEGFISQSSKRIHFGIARHETIDHLTVHWPNGTPQTFHGLVADKHYSITQHGAAVEWQAPTAARTERLLRKDSTSEATSACVLLDVPIHIPQVHYDSLDGDHLSISADHESPLLVSLWANWCQPCLSEIDDWKSHAERFRAAGVEILLLNVEMLDDALPHEPTPDTARQAMFKLGSPFDLGLATPSTLHLLQVVHDTLLRNQPLPLPTSFLFDRSGRLAALYKGSTDVDRILFDVRSMRDTRLTVSESLPFAGTWHGAPRRFREAALFRRLLDDGLVSAANEYRLRYATQLKADPDYATLLIKLGNAFLQDREFTLAADAYREALTLNPKLAIALFDLGLTHEFQGEQEKAISYYRRAIELNPKQVQALLNLGVLLAKRSGFRDGLAYIDRALEVRPAIAIGHFYRGRILQATGRHQDARLAYLESYRLDPAHVETWFPLAKLQAKHGDKKCAMALYQKLIRKRPDVATLHVHLGVLLESQDTRAAIEQYEQALSIEPDHLSAANNLSWLLATCRDADLRNNAESIRLAELATRLTDSERPDILDTLAAAYASDGRYDQAIKTIDRALQLARTQRLADLQQQLLTRKELYQNRHPFRN